MLSYNFFAGIAKFPLLAIPFFILAGYIMERSGIAARIVALMEALVGSMTGGLAVATVAVATFWGAVSGSGPATVAAWALSLSPAWPGPGMTRPLPRPPFPSPPALPSSSRPASPSSCTAAWPMFPCPALFAAGFVPGIVVALFTWRPCSSSPASGDTGASPAARAWVPP